MASNPRIPRRLPLVAALLLGVPGCADPGRGPADDDGGTPGDDDSWVGDDDGAPDDDASDDDAGDDDGEPAPVVGDAPAVPPPPGFESVGIWPVADPGLDPDAAVSVRAEVAEPESASGYDAWIEGEGGPVRTLAAAQAVPADGELHVSWDLRDDAATAVAPGAYRLNLLVRRGVRPPDRLSGTVWVVRLGAAEISLTAATDGASTEVPLLYHRTGGERRNYFVVPDEQPEWSLPEAGPGEAELDGADGEPRPGPAPWSDLESPPVDGDGVPLERGASLPSAFVAGSRVVLAVRLGETALAGGHPVAAGVPAGLPVRVVATGYDPSPRLQPGDEAVLTSLVSPAPLVGRYPLSLALRFEWQDATGTWWAIPGESRADVVVYGLAGPSTAGDGVGAEGPYDAWVEVVDAVATWVGGSTADPAEVAAIVERAVLYGTDLRYDTASGASAYTSYPDWDRSRFDLSAFLRRDNGTVVNCSDCASIVQAYANMAGCDVDYLILGWDFDLNFIRAIGTEAFTEYPFGEPWGGGFSYHAVTSPDGGATVYDATLAMDGDADPRSLPALETPPDGVDGGWYLWALSSEWDTIGFEYQARTQIY